MRESLNADRSEQAVQNALKAVESGASVDVLFARVTGHLGMGHVRANFPSGKGSTVEIKAQIPNVLGRKGTTPINSQTVVAVYVGHGFDASKVLPDTHFKIVAVLRDSQAAQLVEAGVLPEWMTVRDASATAETPDEGFVFDYTDAKGVDEEDEGDEDDEDEEDDEEEEDTKPAAAAAAVAVPAQKTKSGKPNHRATAAMNTLDEDGTGFSFE
jgi:hypothetical protein